MDVQPHFDCKVTEHADVFEQTREAICEPIARLVSVSVEALRSGKKLLFFGNGGSANHAQHIATELTVRYRKDRPALVATALTTDPSALTAIGNHFGFDEPFSRQVEALLGAACGCMTGLADPFCIVPSKTTARIQEMHILIGHMLCAVVEKALCYAMSRARGAV